MNCQSDWAPRCSVSLCFGTHMEDTWSYITAFTGHNKRAVRGLCQDVVFIFLCLALSGSTFFSPSRSVCTVITWSCLLILLHRSSNGLIRKKKNDRLVVVVVVCSCLYLCLSLLCCLVGLSGCCLPIRKPDSLAHLHTSCNWRGTGWPAENGERN